jgi:hypothetical protein
MAGHRRFADISSGVALVVAIAGACFAFWQGWISRDTERRSLRPYVYVSSRPITGFNPGEIIKGSYAVLNGGGTPAYGVEDTIHIKTLPFPLSHDIAKEATPVNTKSNASYLFKDMQLTIDVTGMNPPRPLTADESEALLNETTTRIYVWGEITYHDIFGISHWTNYCVVMDGAAVREGKTPPCDQHNDADER